MIVNRAWTSNDLRVCVGAEWNTPAVEQDPTTERPHVIGSTRSWRRRGGRAKATPRTLMSGTPAIGSRNPPTFPYPLTIASTNEAWERSRRDIGESSSLGQPTESNPPDFCKALWLRRGRNQVPALRQRSPHALQRRHSEFGRQRADLPRSAGRAAPNPSALSWKSLGRRTGTTR